MSSYERVHRLLRMRLRLFRRGLLPQFRRTVVRQHGKRLPLQSELRQQLFPFLIHRSQRETDRLLAFHALVDAH